MKRIVSILLIGPLIGAANRMPTTLPVGTPIMLETAQSLSSRTHAKGDLVDLRTTEALFVDGHQLIPAGTPAIGQVSEARARGAMGMGGKLVVRPLFLRVGQHTVRLRGRMVEKGAVEPGAVIGVLLIPAISGRSAVIPAGTQMPAEVEKTVTLD